MIVFNSSRPLNHAFITLNKQTHTTVAPFSQRTWVEKIATRRAGERGSFLKAFTCISLSHVDESDVKQWKPSQVPPKLRFWQGL